MQKEINSLLKSFEKREIKSRGNYYGTGIYFRWMDTAFSWLHEYWVVQSQHNRLGSRSDIWYMIRNYPQLVRDRVMDNYAVDLANDSEESLINFFEETGLIEIYADKISPYVSKMLYMFAKLVKTHFR